MRLYASLMVLYAFGSTKSGANRGQIGVTVSQLTRRPKHTESADLVFGEFGVASLLLSRAFCLFNIGEWILNHNPELMCSTYNYEVLFLVLQTNISH